MIQKHISSLSGARPFDVNRIPVFYGWAMLPMIVLCMLGSCPGQTAGLSPFYDYLIEATGLSRQALANTYLVGTLCSACALPFAGRLIDIWGTRVVALAAAAVMSATLMALSRVDLAAAATAQRLGLGMAPIVVVFMILLFAILRFVGQGLMTLCAQTTVGHWFDKKRGLAMGINGIITSLVGSSAPLLINVLIGPEGAWRSAWLALATIALPVIALLIWLLWRDTPEACGQYPDGVPHVPSSEAEPAAMRGWTRSEALRTQAFWNVAATQAFLGLVITALTFHIVDWGAGVGISRPMALSFFIPFSVTTTIFGFTGGLIADRTHARPLVITMNALIVVAMLTLTRFAPGPWFFAGAITLGMATGLSGPVGIATYPRFFGRRHLGAINGAQWTGSVIGSAIGPALFAAMRGAGGDYRAAIWVLIPVPLLLGLIAIRLRTPLRRADA